MLLFGSSKTIYDSSAPGIALGDGPFQIEQRRFSQKVMKDFGIGTKSIEPRIQEDLLEFLEKVKKNEGEAIEHTRIFNSHIVSSLWSVMMSEKLERSTMNNLIYIATER